MKSRFSMCKCSSPDVLSQKHSYLCVAACICALFLSAAPGATAQEARAPFHAAKGYRSRVDASHGLRIITFRTPEGQILVNLPDDMRASETIIGSMRLKPKGLSDSEKTSASRTLATYNLQLGAESHAVDEAPQKWTVPSIEPPDMCRVTLFDAGNHAE